MVQHRATIFARATGDVAAAIAVIRLSGPAVTDVLAAMVGGPMPKPRRATLRSIIEPSTSAVLDRGLVLFMPGPASFSGEDCAEFHLHGGRAVIQSVLSALQSMPGLRMAEPGEFTRRAFEHGRLDLTEVEGLGDLIAAETEGQRRLALAVASGGLSKEYAALRDQIIHARALLEAQIDFSDEDDVTDIDIVPLIDLIDSVMQRIDVLVSSAPAGRLLRDGFRVVLAGKPNAGKSSLINRLAGTDLAIVSSEAGTTRDVLTVRLDLDGQLILLQDVAGLREAMGEVEAEGIRRARQAAAEADLVLYLDEEGVWDDDMLDSVSGPIVRVWSKIDQADGFGDETIERDIIPLSIRDGRGVARLIAAIKKVAGAVSNIDSVPVHMRHVAVLNEARACLAAAKDDMSLTQWDFAADRMRCASLSLGSILGHVDVEDVLGDIFARFCIGK